MVLTPPQQHRRGRPTTVPQFICGGPVSTDDFGVANHLDMIPDYVPKKTDPHVQCMGNVLGYGVWGVGVGALVQMNWSGMWDMGWVWGMGDGGERSYIMSFEYKVDHLLGYPHDVHFTNATHLRRCVKTYSGPCKTTTTTTTTTTAATTTRDSDNDND